ncbi:MAG: hypothetical protein ACYTFG_20555, partial [Planctomycetota bacterium]
MGGIESPVSGRTFLVVWLLLAGLLFGGLGWAQEKAGDESAKLLEELLKANRAWLAPGPKRLAYTFYMGLVGDDEEYVAKVDFSAPGSVIVLQGRRETAKEVDNSYDPDNTAYPPTLVTILQGVSFFGPLQELALNPRHHRAEAVEEKKLPGKDILVLRITSRAPPSHSALAKWEEKLRAGARVREFQYDLEAVIRERNGKPAAEIQVRWLQGKGPKWSHVEESLETHPDWLEWRDEGA